MHKIVECVRFKKDRCPDNPKDCHKYENCGIVNKPYPAGYKKEDYMEDE